MGMDTHFDMREARRSLGFTQQELAGHLDVNLSTVWRWEKGETPIPKTVVLALQALSPKPTGQEASTDTPLEPQEA